MDNIYPGRSNFWFFSVRQDECWYFYSNSDSATSFNIRSITFCTITWQFRDVSSLRMALMNILIVNKNGTRWRSWLIHCPKSRNVVGSISDDISRIFHWNNPSGHAMALGSTQPLRGMSTLNIKVIKELTSNTSYFIVCEATCFGLYVTIIRPSYESSR